MTVLEEIVVDAFLPTARSMLAEALSQRDLTQREIATAIGVSQSAVSKYVHGEVERHPAIDTDERVRERVDEIAEAVATGAMDSVGVIIELEVLIRQLEAPGEVLATLHEQAVPGIADRDGSGRIHDPDSRLRREEQVRASVRRAVRRLERTPEFARLLPQVGTNVVEALPDAERVGDVVGIPGRIIDVEGRVAVPGEPRFGVSGHLAGVLLAARKAGSPAAGAINIRYDSTEVEALRSAGEVVIDVPGDRDLAAVVLERVGRNPQATVLVQPGAVGVEPITYLLGADAPDVVDRAIGLLDR